MLAKKWRKENPSALLVGMQPLWIIVWNFLKKLRMKLPFELAIPLRGLYPKNPETPIQKNLCTPMFIAALFTIAKCWKQPKCPSVTERIKKLWYRFPVKMEVYVDKLCLLTQPQKELQLNFETSNTHNHQQVSCMEVQQPRI